MKSALMVIAGSCCTRPELDVGSMGGRLDFGFNVAARADFDLDMRVDFDGDISFWCDIDAATQANFEFDLSGMAAYAQTLQADVDDDGVLETVQLLAFGPGDPANPERVFASWTGDAYTYDEGRCYLLWWEDDTVELLSAECGSAEPALHCTVTQGGSASPVCDVCDAGGDCADCGEDTVNACVDEGERVLERQPPAAGGTGGGGGTGEDAGAAGDSGMAGAPQGGTGGLGGTGGVGGAGGSITIDFDTCMAEVEQLSGRAERCQAGVLRDATTLCTDRVSDVNVCFVTVEGAAFLGSECNVLRSAVCAGVFP